MDYGLLKTFCSIIMRLTSLMFPQCLAYVCGKALYNILLHPQRRFPGPKTWAVSRVRYAISQIGGRPHEDLLRLHDKYGPIVRIANNELSLIHPDAWKDSNGHRKGSKPENVKEPLATVGNEHNLFGASLEDHSRMRRVLSHGFSMQAILDQQPLISVHVDLFIRRLHEHCKNGTSPVDMVTWYNRVTFDIISDLSWGEPLGCLAKQQDHPWIAALSRTVKHQMFRGLAMHFPPFSPLLKALIPEELSRGEEENFALAAASTIEKREMVSNSFLLMLGGSETSATALSAVTFFVTSHPKVMERLTNEIRSAFPREEDIDVHSVQKLPYLLAVLDETLRLNPPLPHTSPRVVRKGGDEFRGYCVPEGTVISIPHWAMYHSSSNFTEPESFIPERWLGDPRFETDQRDGRKPFSLGPRNCIGMNLAYIEMRTILARAIWNFEMRLADESKSWTQGQ
ncbi:unnamed protein product [Colletotrichum noveboracense]|uniref:Cytochrome P450 n=1 Tax=Colletotrichum noveboracense TaxID=2664923 RepID=A0A9W4RJX2_9PEZI|nr:unnamed protein product [Colletotrichum noveboracense]